MRTIPFPSTVFSSSHAPSLPSALSFPRLAVRPARRLLRSQSRICRRPYLFVLYRFLRMNTISDAKPICAARKFPSAASALPRPAFPRLLFTVSFLRRTVSPAFGNEVIPCSTIKILVQIIKYYIALLNTMVYTIVVRKRNRLVPKKRTGRPPSRKAKTRRHSVPDHAERRSA